MWFRKRRRMVARVALDCCQVGSRVRVCVPIGIPSDVRCDGCGASVHTSWEWDR